MEKLSMRRGLITALLALSCPCSFVTLNGALAQDADPQPQERHISLKGPPEDPKGIEWLGPNAFEHVRFEPEGLRITLPAGYPGERPFTGLRISTPCKGDFTVTVSFDLLREPDPKDVGTGATRLIAIVQLNQQQGGGNAGLARRVVADAGPQFSAYVFGGGFRAIPTAVKQGRLQIARMGSNVSFSVAEGRSDSFNRIQEFPFYMNDLSRVQLVGVTSSPDASLDVRFHDLRIRSGNLANVQSASRNATAATASPTRGLLATAFLVCTVVISTIALGLWFFFRQRRANEAVTEDQK